MKSALGIRLAWPGRDAPVPGPVASLSPARAGAPGFLLVHGDNLLALRSLAGRPERAALCYLDPPFFTGRQHQRVTRQRRAGSGRIVRDLRPAFDDRWDGLEHYLSELGARIEAARALLLPDGCLVLHVDPKTSHYAKVLCDEIFGPRCFASEIVWRYRRWPAKTPNFQRVHDVLLRYVLDPAVRPCFRQLYEPLAASTLATWGTRKQRAIVGNDGRRERSSRTAEPTPGAPMGDVWEIGIVAPVARERTGYPTQKPEALLERLVQSCTRLGDLVIDPYLGSGTTLAVCAKNGRRGVGIDANVEAIEITQRRLADLGVRPKQTRVVVPELRLAKC